jgi:pyruvate decarboxylase
VPLVTELDPNPEALEKKILSDVLAQIQEAKQPIIIVDGGATRHRVLKEVEELIQVSGFPVYTTPMGKGAIDEKSGRFAGVYVGLGSAPDVREAVESADLVLWIGSYPADFNT